LNKIIIIYSIKVSLKVLFVSLEDIRIQIVLFIVISFIFVVFSVLLNAFV